MQCQKLSKSEFDKISAIKNVPGSLYSCVECRVHAGAAKTIKAQLTAQVEDLKKEVKELKDQMMTKVDTMETQIQAMVTSMDNYVRVERKSEHVNLMKRIDEISKNDNTQSYAEKLKMKGRNTLVVRSTADGKKASDSKKEILSNLKHVQIEKIKTAKQGHVIVNLPNKEMLDKAKKEIDKLESTKNLEVREKAKIKPKIMVCNVSNEEDEKEIVDSILSKSP